MAALALLEVATFCMSSKRAERLIQPSFSAASSSMQLVSNRTFAATLREPQIAQAVALPANAPSTINQANKTRMSECPHAAMRDARYGGSEVRVSDSRKNREDFQTSTSEPAL
jgi:hypothetical protein